MKRQSLTCFACGWSIKTSTEDAKYRVVAMQMVNTCVFVETPNALRNQTDNIANNKQSLVETSQVSFNLVVCRNLKELAPMHFKY